MMPPAMGNCDCKVIGINQDGMHLGLTVVINALTITGGKNNFIASGTFQETGGGVDVFLTGTGNSISFTDVKISNNTAVGSVQSYGGGVNIDSGEQSHLQIVISQVIPRMQPVEDLIFLRIFIMSLFPIVISPTIRH